MPARTARERWSQFLRFVVVWVLAAIVGSTLLLYLSGGFEPRPTPAEPELAPAIAEAHTPEPPPAPVSQAVVEARAPEPAIKHAREKLREKPAPLEPVRVMTDSERTAKVATHIRRAAKATDAGDYEQATLAYESALELEPNNFEVKILMAQVMSLSELEARDAEHRFRETRTELTTDGTRSESRTAELIIEILPSAPNPGDPYIVRVRAHNASELGLRLTSVELVDAHDSMKSERGRPVTPLAQRLGPQETALLWERRSDWTVADRTGVIDVLVVLADGSRLSKSLRW